MMREEVGRGKTVIARGKVFVEGEFEILGWRRDGGELNLDRFAPIYTLSDCTVTLERKDYTIVDGKTIPESWEKLAKIAKDRVVFIYGGVDCGKSSLATYLINKLGGWVLDLDIGQSDVAHPGAMGYGFSDGGIVSLSDVKMENGFFVGCISPTGREARCLRGVERLWRELESRDGCKVIDTTGWVRGRKAREYKLAKLEIIQPDIIASFSGNNFFDGFEVFEVEKGFSAEKSREERIRTRKNLYRRWIANSQIREIPVSKIKTESTLFSGKDIPREFIEDVVGKKVVFVRKGDDFLNVCVSGEVKIDGSILRALKELYDVEDFNVFSTGDLKGLIVGLYRGRRYLGMGVLEEILKEQGFEMLRIRTPVTEDFDRVEFGEVRFDGEKEYIVRIP